MGDKEEPELTTVYVYQRAHRRVWLGTCALEGRRPEQNVLTLNIGRYSIN